MTPIDADGLRADGRRPDELRPLRFRRDYTSMASGSVLAEFGATRVLCTASVDEDVPRWLRTRGSGWLTAEYSMLPGSSPERVARRVRGPHEGDPAPHRPVAAHGDRPRRARQAPGDRGLRRAAG